jgi:hypothetical protein
MLRGFMHFVGEQDSMKAAHLPEMTVTQFVSVANSLIEKLGLEMKLSTPDQAGYRERCEELAQLDGITNWAELMISEDCCEWHCIVDIDQPGCGAVVMRYIHSPLEGESPWMDKSLELVSVEYPFFTI